MNGWTLPVKSIEIVFNLYENKRMADANHQDSIWPLPKFKFHLDFESNLKDVVFQEVVGLEFEDMQTIEYQIRDHRESSSVKTPGVVNYAKVIMRRSAILSSNGFWDWYKQIQMNTIVRQTAS